MSILHNTLRNLESLLTDGNNLWNVIILAKGIKFVRLEEENEKQQENEGQDNGKAGGKEDSRKMRLGGGGRGERVVLCCTLDPRLLGVRPSD